MWIIGDFPKKKFFSQEIEKVGRKWAKNSVFEFTGKKNSGI